MTPAQLSRTVLHTVRCAAQRGELLLPTRDGLELPERVVVEAPPKRGEGDYSVSVAFRLAKASGVAPYEVAQVLRARLAEQDGVRSVEVTGGGFLNITLEDRARAALVEELTRAARAHTGVGADAPVRTVPARTATAATATATAATATAIAATAEGAAPSDDPAPDDPATDIARWSAVTGDAPAALAVRTSRSSPLFHVQYAHARTRALSRNARDLGFCGDPYACTGKHSPSPGVAPSDSDSSDSDGNSSDSDRVRNCDSSDGRPRSPYGSPSARALLALLADHRRISEQSDPARQARHLVAVGDAFFEFHDRCPPLPRGDEKPGAAHRARMALVEATGAVLAGGLSQLGVTAPARL
ncbi:DALR anticodon-binding domain-containing protein [Streptomyces ovatisporus]|uniref:arginine--tRNA ligase n=1 Tax=Streptomyces ovatisporus TaxID=1128682 RepID=A0ABV9A1G7_9ACTN